MKELLTIGEFRNYMKELASRDSSVKSVQVSAASIEECLEQAAIELGTTISKLEYEVIVKGFKGLLGMMKKNYTLVVYKIQDRQEEQSGIEDFGTDEFVEDSKIINKDGEVVVTLYKGNVLMKVLPPIGRGKKATPEAAYNKLNARNVKDYDKAFISKIVKLADAMQVKVGTFDHIPSNDSIISLKIEENDMKAYITVTMPGNGGSDLGKDTVLSFLKNNMVIYGVDEQKLEDFLDHPVYGSRFLVAEGSVPVNGNDAEIIYNFNIESAPSFLKEKNGRIDFKDKNLVQNVVEGQVLAEKIPAEKGKKGRTVTGKTLDAKDGADKELKIGNNTVLSKDGLKAIASCNGQVLLVNERITVENVYMVEGDVNLTTGNIHFLGTVVVKGNVEDGFSVKATGNIEVMGNVGKCNLDAVGNILVHQGINCRGEGLVKAGKGVVAKFIQNSNVEAGEIVFVSDGIINSYVDSNSKIICKGKRATIVGGKLRATEEISAKTFGSMAVGSTEIEVGFDPKSKERLLGLEKEKEALEKELDEIDRNLVTLENLKKKLRDKFPEDKQQMLDEITGRIKSINEELKELAAENEEIFKHIHSLKSVGRVSASATVYPGVKITIKDARLDVKNELKRLTFINEDSIIKTIKYEEPEDESFEED
ncbi:MAG: FapA family protein [Spirochaetales bacterium]|nr:FapA family protein [Spirochaetales bacterium]